MNDERLPPADNVAEQAVLGAVMRDPRLWEILTLKAADFYRPAHEQIWHAYERLVAKGAPLDPPAVLSELGDEAAKVGAGPYVFDLYTQAPPARESAEYYARIVADKAALRRAIAALTGSLQKAYQPDVAPDELLEHAENSLAKVATGAVEDVDTLMMLHDFIDRDLGPIPWVSPGLIEAKDRIIVTGAESLGKSTFFRQIALSVAAGMDPFMPQRNSAEPKTVLYIDIENGDRLMLNRFRALNATVQNLGFQVPQGRLWIDRRDRPLNVFDAADHRWLNTRLAATNPDLLIIGPVYKMYSAVPGDSSGEIGATRFSGIMDEFRHQYDTALMLEHHMPKGSPGHERSVVPIGSSLWPRWIETGLGLRPVDRGRDVTPAEAEKDRLVELVPWKKRDTRTWPRYMKAGVGQRELPWVESDQDGN